MAGYIGTKTASLSTTAANVTGNITVSGNVDGRDVSVDGTKLDTIPVISTSSTASFIAISDGTTDGYIQLNCSANSHGIKLKSPPHSAGASYTLVFPVNDGNANQVLTTNGSGVLSWSTTSSTDSTKLPLAGGALTGVLTTNSNVGIGTATPQTRIHSTSSQEQLTLSEGNAKGATFDYRSSTGNLNIATNGANARSAPQLTLDLNGKVGIGTEAPARQLSISSTDTTSNISLHNSTSGVTSTDGFLMQINGTTTYLWNYEAGDMVFATNNSVPMRLTSAGDVEMTGAVTPTDGIYLGGTGTANKLSDFETGNWTPNVANLTLSQVSAKYVKVGTLVSFSVQFLMPSTSSSSGMTITGLPFGTSGDGSAAMGYTTSGDFDTYHPTFLVQSTTIYVYRANALRPLSGYSGAYVRLSGHYISAS